MKNIFFLFLCLLPAICPAQNQDFRLYGNVHTVENKTLTGYITWGKDKMYWIDIFRASKPTNPYTHYFNANDGILFRNNGQDSPVPPTHVFACRFGNIKTIEPTDYNKITLEIKDGNTIRLNRGNYTDIGAILTVYTHDNTYTSIKWDKISKIEFMSPDSSFSFKQNQPICGIVKANQGLYKGFITWDKDEKTTEGILDGRTRAGVKGFPFSSIHKILKTNNACKVILHNGEEWDMWGTNDVNDENRGIIVNMPNIGTVTIPWKNFEAFEAVDIQHIDFLSYNDFGFPERIYGEVVTRKGESVTGYMAYDLDEAMNFELLDGKNDNILYEIPFKFLKSIEPKNYKYSFITLINGGSLSLGDSVDVDNENNGILVFPADGIPVYIPWKQIKTVNMLKR